ncbi:Gfo/Idh/MocA family protein [Bacteroidota bacterium]
MDTIGIGLIGCGLWGSIHAQTYSASPITKLISTCDLESERVEQFAQKYGAEKSTTDYQEILSDPEITAISITTPDHTHTPIVLDALKAGKHVLVEKPLAMTVEECKKILSVRDSAGTILMVDFHNRWNIPFMQVKNMVEFGELGDLQMISVRLNDTIYVPTKMLGWAAQSSPAHFLGSHVVDLIRWLSGSEINKVYSVSRSTVLNKKGIDTPDYFQTILELSSGATAYVENCWIVAENAPNVFEFKGEFIGSKGSTYVNVSHHRMVEKYTEDGAGYPDVLGVVDRYGKAAGFCTAPIDHFIECMVQSTEPLVTGEDGLAATQVVQAMEQSAKTGLPVDLDPLLFD